MVTAEINQSSREFDSRVSRSLTFEEGRTDGDLSLLCADSEETLIAVRHTLLHDPDFLNATDCGAFAARNGQKVVLIAPRMKMSVELPVKFGEKVLWRSHISVLRVHPSAQVGVATRHDAEALFRWLRNTRPDEGIALTELMTDSPLYEALAGAESLGYRLIDNKPAPHLFHYLKESYEAFLQEKQSKFKSQLRTKEKLFRERFGDEYIFKEYRTVDDVAVFLNAASTINKKTYQYRLFGETVADDVQSRSLYSDFAQRNQFRSFILWHGSIPLGFILGSQDASGVFKYRKTGFDPEWREYYPGINCTIQMLRRLYEKDRPKCVDFGSGDAPYKRLFSTSTGLSSSPILLPKTARYFLPFILYTSSAYVNEQIAAVLDRLGAKDWIKRTLRKLA